MINLLKSAKVAAPDLSMLSLIWCSLTIHFDYGPISFQGSLSKSALFYKFRALTKCIINDMEKSAIRKINIYIPTNRDIIECTTKFAFINDNCIYFFDISVVPYEDSFSLLWDIKGHISNSIINIPISIFRLGGSQLCFTISDTMLPSDALNEISTIRIDFDNSDTVDLTGKIETSYKIGGNMYCTYRYINILGTTKDKIFRQLFRRQIELKKI